MFGSFFASFTVIFLMLGILNRSISDAKGLFRAPVGL
jgi:hypothetical protein